MSVYLRLFAPFLPFVTEEVWSWWREGSVHRSAWPAVVELETHAGDALILQHVSEVLTVVRRAKSDAKVSMRAEVDRVAVTAPEEVAELIRLGESDLADAARTAEIVYEVGEFNVEGQISDSSN